MSSEPQEALEVSLPFSREEYRERLRRTQEELRRRGLPALLAYAPHTLYYLFGYQIVHSATIYQAVILPAEGAPIAVIRFLDRPILLSSAFGGEIRCWEDVEDPVEITLDALEQAGLARSVRLGVETKHQSLYPFWYERLRASLADKGVTLEEASDIVTEQRIRKSPAEIALMRRAGHLLDVTFQAAFSAMRAGAKESDINAAALYAAHMAGADANPFPYQISSGRNTLSFTHLAATRRVIAAGEPILMEAGASAECYYATGIHTVLCADEPSDEMRAHYAQARQAVRAGRAILGPNVQVSDVAKAMISAGKEAYSAEFMRRFHGGYGIGIGFSSAWQDSLMVTASDPHVLVPGITLMLIGVSQCHDRYTIITADPILITDDGFEDLSTLNGDEMRVVG